jgi:methyltransferase (TIGR00027 family)
MESPIEHVSDTALWVATYRAEETERADALFRDPLAAELAGEQGRRIAQSAHASKYTRWNVVMRTCVIDRFVADAVAEGVDTVVNLGAGLDTRPYRLELPSGLRWVEADFPPMIEAKEKALAGERPRVRLERRPVDLGDAGARAAFLDELQASSRKILVITEGVIPYLANEEVAALARDLAARGAFRLWVVDYMAPRVAEYLRKGRMKRQMKNAPFRFHPGDWFAFYGELGWRPKEMRYLADEARAQKRPIPAPLLMRVVLPFLPKARRDELRRFTGYCLLERG